MGQKASVLRNEEQLRGLETAPVSGDRGRQKTELLGSPNEDQLRGAGQTPDAPFFVSSQHPPPATSPVSRGLALFPERGRGTCLESSVTVMGPDLVTFRACPLASGFDLYKEPSALSQKVPIDYLLEATC